MAIKVSFREALSEIKNRMDILSVISKYLNVKRSGSSYVSLCPFHSDKSPSMHISPQKGIYKCFSCGASGDLFTFITDYKKISFTDAVHELATECGLEIFRRDENSKLPEEQELIFEMNRLAALFFQNNLWKNEEAKIALNYLQQERGLNNETIESFELGFSSTNKTDLLSYLQSQDDLGNKIKEPEFLIKSGLFIEDKKLQIPIDRFRGRLMIPIKDIKGRVVAFGARTLNPDIQPKYLNSPETAIYHKSHHLFGLNIAQNFTKQKRQILLLEGYFDVIQAHQSGINYAVGSLGTALTREQTSLLYQSNLSRRIILGFDNDEAGIRALISSLHVFQEGNFSQKLDLRVLELNKEYKDIDEYLKNYGSAEIEKLLNESAKAYDFLIERKVQNLDLNDAEKRSDILNDLIDLIKDINDPIEKEILAEKCARLLSFNKSTIMQLLFKSANKFMANESEPSQKQNVQTKKNKSFNNRKQGAHKQLTRIKPPKPSNDAEKTLLSLLLLTDDESLIEQVKGFNFKDDSIKEIKDFLSEIDLQERLKFIEDEQVPHGIEEIVSIAAWNKHANKNQLFQECMLNLAEQEKNQKLKKMFARRRI